MWFFFKDGFGIEYLTKVDMPLIKEKETNRYIKNLKD